MSNAVLLALVAIVPLVLLTLTSFVKISVVLSLLRNALGAPDAPSGLVVTGLALVLTFFVMAPIALDMSRAATSQPAQPAQPAQASDEPWRALVPADYQPQVDQLERGLGPLRAFLAKHAAAKDQATFVELAGKLGHRDVRDDELWVLAPAFVTSELRAAFTMAILIFIPFLVLDLVVALGLASLGLATTPPQAIALPLKLLLFVAVDGWRLLIDSLLRGYA
ncbi:MAG TPA: flagellar type III secretion system pore protein FliP [Kofleriaceae bacterium]|nr:flagellar type III secretion system pore protein FliP [Kofleriaceae bacterium]